MSGFAREAVEAAGADWDSAETFNRMLERLSAQCESSVDRAGDLARSKVAWKLCNYRLAMIYRGTLLGEAAAELWNARNVIGSVLASRALMETGAVFRDFVEKCQGAYEKQDVPELNRIADSSTFTTKKEEWLPTGMSPATNILTSISKLDKKFVRGIARHYENLSEFCHPNYSGTFAAFAQIDYDSGRVSFSKMTGFNAGMFSHVLAAGLILGVIERDAKRLQELIPQVAALQFSGHRPG